ncbi:hypothetical protein ACS0TY_015033 [Phlomoides rotata]
MYTDFKPFSMMGLPNKMSTEKEMHAMLKRDFFEEKEENAVSVSVLKIKLACAEDGDGDGVSGCSTPKAVDQKMDVSLKCPPPPRKPKSVPSLKRKAQRDDLLDLSHELESLFPANILRDFMCGKIKKIRTDINSQ